MAKAQAPDAPLTVDVHQLAALFKCDQRTVRKLAERGIVITAGRGRFEFMSSVQNYILHLREIAADKVGNGTANAVTESALLNRERRRRLLQDGEIAAGKLIPVEFVEEVMADHIKGLRGMVLGWANEAMIEMPHLNADDLATLRKISEKVLRDNAVRSMEVGKQHPIVEEYVRSKRGEKTI